MHTTAELLDAAKVRVGISSDYKLAAMLAVSSTATVTNYRAGRSHPDDLIGQRIAELSGLDAGYVLACLHAQRARDEQTRALWVGVAQRLQRVGLAGVLVAFCAASGVIPTSSAANVTASAATLNVMSTRRRSTAQRRARAWRRMRLRPVGKVCPGLNPPPGGVMAWH